MAALDEYARTAGLASRSAALRHAVALLRTADLEREYAAAWDEWDASGSRDAWERTTDDGLTEPDATR